MGKLDDESADEVTAGDVAALLRELREVMHLDDDDPRRVAAMIEKRRLLGLIEESPRG
jgi:hypothetical protein